MVRQTGAEAIRNTVSPAVESVGLYLEDVVVTRAGSRSVVRVVVDLPEDEIGSLDLDAVAEATRAVSAALDETDVVAGAYTLEVSSPGTARPLTTPRHFKRARTRRVRLTLRSGGTVIGRLSEVDDALHVDDGSGLRAIPLTDVVAGQIEVELARPVADEDSGEMNDDRIDEEA
jgi:ribosome maturation factor RimP